MNTKTTSTDIYVMMFFIKHPLTWNA